MRMWCQSCREEYKEKDAGTCKECYEEASETEEELKREIEDLKAKVSFLRICPPVDPHLPNTNADLLLYGVSESHEEAKSTLTPAVPAHRAVLISRSPVFKAMLETEMEENKSGMIKIYDVSYEVLRSFVKYLYTAEVLLDEQMACDLLILAEKYQVKHLKSFCEKFMTSKVNNENAIASYAFAHQHHAKQLIEAALSSIIENISTLTEREEFKELLERDPRLVVEIYEAYLTRQVNTAEK
ncbi:BTB/POZ domain-containing protein At4g08455 [Dendrobium catenatum]|uniref:BTB/POZ domain-containing protein n=1 Tax=Dendrobium catenatum TaxID=906689 RepID=A0A2I0XF63_9ASPA|nr:BTB/POZ domain-containing protein At4g08455 [Dendrobium catenatum]PKU86558.1 BTB/POZ domain-containing protein [Dendrobium catenatum]